jgi:hypothetical protein
MGLQDERMRRAMMRGGLNGQTIFSFKEFDIFRDKVHKGLRYNLTSAVKIRLYIEFIIIPKGKFHSAMN